jgi:hypothetical protein
MTNDKQIERAYFNEALDVTVRFSGTGDKIEGYEFVIIGDATKVSDHDIFALFNDSTPEMGWRRIEEN